MQRGFRDWVALDRRRAPPSQEFFSKLQGRAVAYINVDVAVMGTGWALRGAGLTGVGR